MTREEAEIEIDNFKSLSEPCPWFRELYDRELQAHIAKAVPLTESASP